MGEESWFDRHRRRREAAAYATELARWELECERLDEALAGASPDTEALVSKVGTRLRPGEFLQYELWDVDLVETRQLPAETVSRQANLGVNTPVSVGFSTTRTVPTPPTDQSVVLDTGTVAFTDQRVTFAGRKHAREWPLAHLIRPVLDDDKCTIYLPLSSRDLTSGFRYGPHLFWPATSQFEIALARHSGDWHVVDRWRARREHLARTRPQPPAHLAVATDAVQRARTQLLEEQEAAADTASEAGPAHLGRRSAARAIDGLLVSLLISYLALLFGDSGSATLLAIVIGVALYEVVPVWRQGGSVGKRAVGLAVVDVDRGTRPPLWQSFLRAAVLSGAVVTIVAPVLQLVRLAMGIDNQTWHDRVAGTAVVHAPR